jgi:hypothetical protein
MATDARGHTVPAASDVPSRNTLLTIAKTTRDITPVTNTTTRGTAVTAMTAEGLAVATTNPLLVLRADAPSNGQLELTKDGTNWLTVEALPNGVQTYTPALIAVTTNPTMGSGAIQSGQYTYGLKVNGHADIVFGTGMTPGSGNYALQLPVAVDSGAVSVGRILGYGVFVDVSASTSLQTYSVFLLAVSTTTARLVIPQVGLINQATPVVPAVGDRINVDFNYIPA